jgi:hypothetical protein
MHFYKTNSPVKSRYMNALERRGLESGDVIGGEYAIARASSVALCVMADKAARWATAPYRNLREAKEDLKTCVFPKRTHRFLTKRRQLFNSDTMSYTINRLENTVGSFSKTNPPERVLRWDSVAPGAQIGRVSSDSAWKTNPPGRVF